MMHHVYLMQQTDDTRYILFFSSSNHFFYIGNYIYIVSFSYFCREYTKKIPKQYHFALGFYVLLGNHTPIQLVVPSVVRIAVMMLAMTCKSVFTPSFFIMFSI